MSSTIDSLATVNSLIRTLLAVVVVGALGTVSWIGYTAFNTNGDADARIREKDEKLAAQKKQLTDTRDKLAKSSRRVTQLTVEVANKERQIQRLDTALRLVKVDKRVARVRVLDQTTDDAGQTISHVRFEELNEDNEVIDQPKEFKIPGKLIYIDAWVVKFLDKYVERGDLERSASIVLFRRVYSDVLKPMDGIELDSDRGRPSVYGTRPMNELERKIWDDFWNVANDEKKQEALGIRAAHGEAPFMQLKAGKTYRLTVRASGGLSFDVEDNPPPVKRAAQ